MIITIGVNLSGRRELAQHTNALLLYNYPYNMMTTMRVIMSTGLPLGRVGSGG